MQDKKKPALFFEKNQAGCAILFRETCDKYRY